jgi:hypothetical protein
VIAFFAICCVLCTNTQHSQCSAFQIEDCCCKATDVDEQNVVLQADIASILSEDFFRIVQVERVCVCMCVYMCVHMCKIFIFLICSILLPHRWT